MALQPRGGHFHMAALPAVNSLITHSYPWRCFRSREFSFVLCSGTDKENELKMQGFLKTGDTGKILVFKIKMK